MRITQSHKSFWLYHCGPKWVRRTSARYPEAPSIHACINDHVPLVKFKDTKDASNTVSLLRMHRKHAPNDMQAYLCQLATAPGTVIRPEHRAALAWRILLRLMALDVNGTAGISRHAPYNRVRAHDKVMQKALEDKIVAAFTK